MTRDAWLGLAKRCEAATGPDREVDYDIGLAIGMKASLTLGDPILGNERTIPVNAPRFTASLDGITALIERELSGAAFWSQKAGTEVSATLSDMGLIHRTEAATEALARCAAFCRAKAASAPSTPSEG